MILDESISLSYTTQDTKLHHVVLYLRIAQSLANCSSGLLKQPFFLQYSDGGSVTNCSLLGIE